MASFSSTLLELFIRARRIKTNKSLNEVNQFIAGLGPEVRSYNVAMADARSKMKSKIRKLYKNKSSKELAIFLIYFYALGYHMAQPKAKWIEQASQACKKRGLNNLNEFLASRGEEEGRRHLLMRHDLQELINLVYHRFEIRLDLEKILALAKVSLPVTRFIQLHEERVSIEFPSQQLAIQTEIELISLLFGPNFLAFCSRKLGGEILKCLSFVRYNSSCDVSYSMENFTWIRNLLKEYPDLLNELSSGAQQALSIYTDYLNECQTLTRKKLMKAEQINFQQSLACITNSSFQWSG